MDTFERKLLKNPRVKANLLSVLLFAWVWPLFWRGSRKELDVEDLCEPLDADRSEKLGGRLEAIWRTQCERAKQTGTSPSFLKALGVLFWKKVLAIGFMDAVNNIGLRLVQPIILGELLSFFSPGSTMSKREALWFAGGLVLCLVLAAALTNHVLYRCNQLGMQMRIACCSLIFRKATRLNRTALGETASGQIVNLLSNDVSRFDIMSIFLNHLWIDPLLTFIIAYLLYSNVGWPGFVGIGTILIIVPIQSYMGALSSKFRLKIALRTDTRVRLMDEIVNGVQVIKMYAWEKPFNKLVSEARRLEIKEVIKVYAVRGIFMTFLLFTTRVSLFATLVTYVMTGNTLKASMVFVIQSYYNILSQAIGTFFVRGISEVAECIVSIHRLQAFLLYDECDGQEDQSRGVCNQGFEDERSDETLRSQSNGINRKEGFRNDTVVEFVGLHAKWNTNHAEDTLKNVTLKLPRGELLAIIGPVGSGKSSLLQAVLGEVATTAGRLSVHGKVSYACQDSWLFSASIRQNIIFGSDFDRKRYDKVVKACALLPDFAQLPYSDLTPVGERGSALSGGQRARVNLARAVYREADLYLLDDPLSAVDAQVGKHLFEECIVKLLAGKTRILVTHQVQYLGEVSRIVILANGEVQMQGTFKELLHSDADYAQMLRQAEEKEDEELEAFDDIKLSEDVVERPLSLERQESRVSTRSARSTISTLRRSSTTSFAGEEVAEVLAPPVEHIEASTRGKVKGSLFFRYFLSGTNVFGCLMILLLFLGVQIAASLTDYFVGFWTNQEEKRAYLAERQPPDTNAEGPLTSTENFIYIFTAIIVSVFVLGIARSFVFYWICSKCSQALHDTMFSNIIRATMHFFNTNPSGRILNRFSKDLGNIDELLPKAMLDAAQFILAFCGYLAVAVSVNWEFAIPVSILLIVFYLARVVYLKTARNIKRLEGMTRSPVFTHLNATIQGLSTIRAFNAQNLVLAEFDNHQNLHTSAWHLFLATSTSFGVVLDMISLCFSTAITFSFLLLDQVAASGDVGLAITQSMAVTGLVIQFGIRQSAEVSSQLLSVERVLEYADLPTEEDRALKAKGSGPPAKWPSEGRVELKKVWMRYAPGDQQPVLKGLTLTINPAEKVGVVGRTGAGKSSLIAAMFRLAVVEGSIVLDDVDTASVPLERLRSSISIIPQEPVLFSGTLRKNLDPFGKFHDHELWAALEDVELKDMAAESGGLETRVMDAGGNFSVGQRQLVCLARAVLRGNKLLMLDEATANVDPQTDALIQRTIRTKFASCTVVTVAHRLNTIMDSDRVLVMDAGRAAEFDHPYLLIQKRGIFYALVQETGTQMAESLARIARENYENKITLGQFEH